MICTKTDYILPVPQSCPWSTRRDLRRRELWGGSHTDRGSSSLFQESRPGSLLSRKVIQHSTKLITHNLKLCPCLAYLWYPRRLTREPTWAHNHSGRSGSSWCTPTPWSPSLQRLQLQHSHPRFFKLKWRFKNGTPDEKFLTISKSFALTMVKCTSVSKAQKKHSCIEGANIEKAIFWSGSKCFEPQDSETAY